MNIHAHPCLLLITTVAFFIAAPSGRAAETPVSLIFDTGMGGDCDDVGALFVVLIELVAAEPLIASP